MPDRRIIHVKEDVLRVHTFAQSLGMLVFSSEPQKKPALEPITVDELKEFNHGTLMLLRPVWIFHEPLFSLIDGGHNIGLYSVRPDVNIIAIEMYVYGEKTLNGVRQLGSGQFSFRPYWLDDVNRSLPNTPVEVGEYYRAITKHFLSNKFAKTSPGKERYYLTRLALQVIETEPTAPPHDFIIWPPDLKPTKKS